MFRDEYVQFLAPGKFDNTDKHYFLVAHVKPRTNEKDPFSKLPYYKLWMIFDRNELHSSSYSAHCGC